jgi:hypothetical protein
MKFTFSASYINKIFFNFLIITCLGLATALAQPKWKLNITGKVEENGKSLDGASIKISKSGAEPLTIYASSNGKFSFSLDPNASYTVRITKPGGYITKIVNFDTKNVPNDEDDRAQPFGFYMEVNIFKEYKGLDLSLLKDPIGKVFYVAAARKFDYDEAYTKSIQSRLIQMQEELEAQLKAEAEVEAKLAKKKAEFDAAIKKGDDANALKKYDDAVKAYTTALETQVDNATANAKITAAMKAKSDEEAKKKADEEAKKKAEEEAKKNAEAVKKKAEFDAAIKKGDDAITAKKFDDAVAAYNVALATKVDDATANAKIAAAGKAKADEEARKKAEEEAKKKAEEEAKKNADYAKKKAEFDAAIKKGDDAVTAKKFDDAVAAYNLALATKVDDATANAKIAAAGKAKADEEARKKAEEEAKKKAEEEAKKNADYAKKKAEFDAAIKKGGDALTSKKFDDAVAAYNVALSTQIDDATSNAKIAAAGKAKADEEARLKAEADAKKKAEEDAKNAAENAKKKAEFDAAIKKGDEAMGAKKFDEAIASYNAALVTKVNDATANSKIEGANKAKADEEARKKAEEEAKKKAEEDAKNATENAKKKAEFDAAIKKGDEAVSAKKFDEAIVSYNAALATKVDDVTANSKIEGANKAKADEEARLKAEADAKAKADADAANAAEQAKKKADFEKAIKDGDAALSGKKYDEALSAYNNALNIHFDDATANSKIEGANKAKADEEARLKAEADAKAKADADAANAAEQAKKKADFEKAIKDGDAALSGKKYDEALSAYNNALNIHFDDATANSKIEGANKAKADEEARLKAEADAKAKAEADAANAAEQAKKKADFETAIKDGDAALANKKFDDALAAYNNALNIHFDDATANSKIEGANKAKADEEARLKAEADAKAKADADAANAAEQAKKKADFETAIKDGDAALSGKKYDEALSAYNNALNIHFDDATANSKIEGANKAKADEEARLKAEADAKAKAEADAANAAEQAKKKADFETAIKDGDAALANKKYDEAISAYNNALNIHFDDATANSKIEGANKAKADEEARLKAEAEAKAKAEADAANAEAAKKKAEFDKLIVNGDNALNAKKFDEAIAAYGSALQMEVDNATANSKIEAAQKAKDDEEARLKAEADAKAKSEADAAAAAEQAKKKAEFDKFIADGDKNLGSKKYDDAINAYSAALGLEIDNVTANNKIEAAQKAKADEEARLKAEADAKAKADADAANAAELARKKAEFDKFIAKGDQGLSSKNYTDAIAQYGSALALDVDNTTANAKIAAAQKAKDEEDARLQAEADAKAKAEADAANAAERARKKAEFEKLIGQGDKSLSAKSFDEAINQYNAALGLDIDNATANTKIADAQKAKSDEEARIAAEADAKAKAEAEAAAAAELARKKAEFEKLVREGDSNLGTKRFDNAIENYNAALAIGYDNAAANAKIAEAEKQKAEEEARRKAMDLAARTKLFNEKIAQGDNLVTQKNYEDAILSYKEALELNIDNPLAQSKIDGAQKVLDAIILARKKAQFSKLIADGDMAVNQKKYAQAINLFTDALNVDFDNATANQKLENAKKLDEAEKARLAAIAAKKQAELDEMNRKKKEAEERERLFLEKARLAREQAKAELVARIEAQKGSLAQAERFKADREKNLQNKTNAADQTSNSSRLDLAKKYSQGTTNEEIEGPNCTIYRTIIVKGDVGDEYKKIKYNFGQVYFKKNDKDIPEAIYNKETKAP